MKSLKLFVISENVGSIKLLVGWWGLRHFYLPNNYKKLIWVAGGWVGGWGTERQLNVLKAEVNNRV
jgi:hypothetical protein